MKKVKSYYAHIYLGLRHGYTKEKHSLLEVNEFAQDYCNHNPLCISVMPTTFFYKGGNEEGAVLTLINYPRFPIKSSALKKIAIGIAETCLTTFHQYRISIEFPEHTIMVENKIP